MFRKLAILTAVSSVLLLGAPAEAAKGAKGKGDLFNTIDTNHDGKISKDELAKFRAQHAGKGGKGGAGVKGGKGNGEGFAKFDTNNDGFLDREEFAAMTAALKAKKANK